MREAGRQEGEATLLLHLIERKLGPLDPLVRQRIAAADAATRLRWSGRVLTARTLDEILAG